MAVARRAVGARHGRRAGGLGRGSRRLGRLLAWLGGCGLGGGRGDRKGNEGER